MFTVTLTYHCCLCEATEVRHFEMEFMWGDAYTQRLPRTWLPEGWQGYATMLTVQDRNGKLNGVDLLCPRHQLDIRIREQK